MWSCGGGGLRQTGLLHGDPHPGNLLLTPDARLGYLDFGLLCRMEPRHSEVTQSPSCQAVFHLVPVYSDIRTVCLVGESRGAFLPQGSKILQESATRISINTCTLHVLRRRHLATRHILAFLLLF